MKKKIISFGGPSNNYHDAVKRLCNQAKSFKIFDEIIGYTDQDLKKYPEFYNKHKIFIENNPRGYGYWIWKPYLILNELEKMEDGDILFYCDAGCELNINGKEKMINFFDKVKKKSILGTKAWSNDLTHTKIDLVYFMGLNDQMELLKKPQMQATVLLIKKDMITMTLFREFYNICSNNYNLLDDSPSVNKSLAEFIEHRHDQSIFSLLAKKYSLLNYDLDPTCFHPNWNRGKLYPIWLIRNRTGVSFIKLFLDHPLIMTIKTLLYRGRLANLFKITK